MNSGKIILGVLAGAAIGATLGILFAPGKGSSVRKKISKKREQFTEGMEEKFDKFVDSVTEKFETVKDEAIRMGGNGKQKTKDFVMDKK
jgi:gas vesicle protein